MTNEVRAVDYELLVPSWKLKNCWFKFTSYDFKSTSSNSWITSSNAQVTSLNPQVTSPNPQVPTSYLPVTSSNTQVRAHIYGSRNRIHKLRVLILVLQVQTHELQV